MKNFMSTSQIMETQTMDKTETELEDGIRLDMLDT